MLRVEDLLKNTLVRLLVSQSQRPDLTELLYVHTSDQP